MQPISHQPVGYSCPFCRLQDGEFNDRNQPTDVVAVTERAYARIAPKWWPGNPGAALVVPRFHVENLYDLAPAEAVDLWSLTQTIAGSIRETYDCDGVSIRQHNEPAGGQDVWHLHVHVFPRFHDDRLYQRHDEATWVPSEERAPYAGRLREALQLPYEFGS